MIHQRSLQGCIALFVAIVGIVLAIGAARLPVEKGYSILGPHVFPFAVATLLIALSMILAIQALRKSNFATPTSEDDAAPTSSKSGAAWVTAGLLVVAALINQIGFVLASALLFTLAARGFGSKKPLRDLGVGISLVLPVYWLFTAGLGVSLPPLINAWI